MVGERDVISVATGADGVGGGDGEEVWLLSKEGDGWMG